MVFEAERDLLVRKGHEVESIEVSNSTIPASPSPLARLRIASRTIWSSEGSELVARVTRAFRPDVMHAHNTFPLLSPAVFRAARRHGAATVQTIHNYRLICPSADLFRDGRPCQDCVGKTVPWPSVVHACYRSSRAQTAVVAGMLSLHRAIGTWQKDVDAFIALTEFARDRLTEGGLPSDRVIVKPNFLEEIPQPGAGLREGFLFVGRLERTKGIMTLLDAATKLSPSVTIRILGSGPLQPEVEAFARESASVEFLGQLDRAQVLATMASSLAVVVPSIWYEPFGLTVIEAYASGTPVIASRLGSLQEIVWDGKTGLHFNPGDSGDLAGKLRWAAEHPERMSALGARARVVYTERYSSEANYVALRAVYAAAGNRRRQRLAQ
ncbi:glycosyltransferase [soil metagenome]